jgi:signal recognition particle GTPase
MSKPLMNGCSRLNEPPAAKFNQDQQVMSALPGGYMVQGNNNVVVVQSDVSEAALGQQASANSHNVTVKITHEQKQQLTQVLQQAIGFAKDDQFKVDLCESMSEVIKADEQISQSTLEKV